jgi:hypothetical protein
MPVLTRTSGRENLRYGLSIDAAPREPRTGSVTMRKTLIALALAAAALTAGTSASLAGGYGYDNHSYGYGYQQNYYQPTCHTVTFKVYDEYTYQYVYRTKQVCN